MEIRHIFSTNLHIPVIMLIENQPVEKKVIPALSVVGRKLGRAPKVKVIKMKPDELPAETENLHPPVTRFNTAYIKARDNDPL